MSLSRLNLKGNIVGNGNLGGLLLSCWNDGGDNHAVVGGQKPTFSMMNIMISSKTDGMALRDGIRRRLKTVIYIQNRST